MCVNSACQVSVLHFYNFYNFFNFKKIVHVLSQHRATRYKHWHVALCWLDTWTIIL